MATTLQIYSLGGLIIKDDGQLMTSLASHKAEALLLYLLRVGRPQPREVLANFLEDDRSHAQSMSNLRVILHRLRQGLDPYLLITRQMIGIDPEHVPWFDVTALEAGINVAKTVWKRTQHLSAKDIKQLETSLELYQGDFLSGFSGVIGMNFEAWLTQQREAISLQVVDALKMLVTASLENRAFSSGIAHASRLLHIDPFQEHVHRQLMILMTSAGQTSAALAQFETCRRLFEEELQVALHPDTLKLRDDIVSGALQIQLSSQVRPPNNLPVQPTPFIGRESELSKITELLQDPFCRLLTVVGIGGTGKTRLSLQAGTQVMEIFPDGVYVVFLEALDGGHLLPASVGSVLKIKPDETGNFDGPLFAYLHDKTLLLVLDAFEHLVDDAEWISRLLAAAPHVKILVTSRERLALSEEWLLLLEGFERPTLSQPTEDNYGVQLFTHIAQRLNTNFSLASTLNHVSAICELVEGMPLAIELAAGWTWKMECAQIRQSLQENLTVLSATVRNIPTRQRNMQVLFQYSWDFLSAEQQKIMGTLALFRGGFTIEAALAVAQADTAALEALIDKSLLRCVEDRYQMHDLLRRFSLEKLQEQHQLEHMSEAYVRYYIEWTHMLYTADDVGDAFSPELNNLRAALSWALKQEDAPSLIELSASMEHHWLNHSLYEGIEWLTHGMRLSGESLSDQQRAKASTSLGILYWRQSDFANAQAHLEAGAELYRSRGGYDGLNKALNHLGYVALNRGDFARARSCFEEILQIARRENKHTALVVTLCNLGMISSEMGDVDIAQRYLEEALQAARALKLQENLAVILNNLGVIMQQKENFVQARLYYEEASAIAQREGLKPMQAVCEVNLGEMAQKAREYATAAAYFQKALQIFSMLGDKLSCLGTIEQIASWAIETQHIEQATLLLGALETQRESLQAPLTPRQQEQYAQWIATLHAHEHYEAIHWQQGQALSFENLVMTALESVSV